MDFLCIVPFNWIASLISVIVMAGCRWGSIDPEGQRVFLTIIQSVTIKMTTDFCWILALCLALRFKGILSIPRPTVLESETSVTPASLWRMQYGTEHFRTLSRVTQLHMGRACVEERLCLSNTVCAVRDRPESFAVGCSHVTAHGRWALSRSDMGHSIQMG